MAETTMKTTSNAVFYEGMFGHSIELKEEHRFLSELRLYFSVFMREFKQMTELPKEMASFLSLMAQDILILDKIELFAKDSTAGEESWNKFGEPITKVDEDNKGLISTYNFLSKSAEDASKVLSKQAEGGEVLFHKLINRIEYGISMFYVKQLDILENRTKKKRNSITLLIESDTSDETIEERSTSIKSKLTSEEEEIDAEIFDLLVSKSKWSEFLERIKGGASGMRKIRTSGMSLELDPSKAL